VAEERTMIDRVREAMGYPFDVILRPVDSIPRLSSNKFEDFVSEVADVIPDRT
jgi:hypothetical protein